MTKKTAVSFTDEHHAFARRMVEEGAFASVSSVVAAGLQRLRDEREERDAQLAAMAEEIRDRAATPDEEFLPTETLDVKKILADVVAARARKAG